MNRHWPRNFLLFGALVSAVASSQALQRLNYAPAQPSTKNFQQHARDLWGKAYATLPAVPASLKPSLAQQEQLREALAGTRKAFGAGAHFARENWHSAVGVLDKGTDGLERFGGWLGRGVTYVGKKITLENAAVSIAAGFAISWALRYNISRLQHNLQTEFNRKKTELDTAGRTRARAQNAHETPHQRQLHTYALDVIKALADALEQVNNENLEEQNHKKAANDELKIKKEVDDTCQNFDKDILDKYLRLPGNDAANVEECRQLIAQNRRFWKQQLTAHINLTNTFFDNRKKLVQQFLGAWATCTAPIAISAVALVAKPLLTYIGAPVYRHAVAPVGNFFLTRPLQTVNMLLHGKRPTKAQLKSTAVVSTILFGILASERLKKLNNAEMKVMGGSAMGGTMGRLENRLQKIAEQGFLQARVLAHKGLLLGLNSVDILNSAIPAYPGKQRSVNWIAQEKQHLADLVSAEAALNNPHAAGGDDADPEEEPPFLTAAARRISNIGRAQRSAYN